MSNDLEIITEYIEKIEEFEEKSEKQYPASYMSKELCIAIKEKLQRLESIDNANPSEALEDSLKLYKMIESAGNGNGFNLNEAWEYHNTIKQALLKAQEQEISGVVGGRTFGKEFLYLRQSFEQCNDKPIFYVSRTYGNKYIIPQKQFDDLTNENAKYKRVLKIIKEKRINVDLFWNDFVDNGFGYNYYLEKWYKYQNTDSEKPNEEEFNLVKEYFGNV